MSHTSAKLYIGLMSGTSVDAIDAAIVDYGSSPPKLISSHAYKIDSQTKLEIEKLCTPGESELDQAGQLDVKLGKIFANAALSVIAKAGLESHDIQAIGCHGQTIRHRPNLPQPFTLQIGDPNTIAYLTGITTVADFRRRDMAAGGQGAPLAPGFHHSSFRSTMSNRAIVNIGGIANITWLPVDGETTGYDIGPGNTLIDNWIKTQKGNPYDKDGLWASTGKLIEPLLQQLLSLPFFKEAPPKSTGREEFSLTWLNNQLSIYGKDVAAEDIQTTLCHLTAKVISKELLSPSPINYEVFVCGGGAHNKFLMQLIQDYLPNHQVQTTEALGIHPDWVEAAAFAQLAKLTLERSAGNIPTVTGANQPVILGGVYYA